MRVFAWIAFLGVFLAQGELHADSVEGERLRSVENQLGDIQEDLRTLLGRVELLEHKFRKDASGESTPSVASPHSTSPAPVSAPAESAASPADSADVVARYNQALGLLKAKKIVEARDAFQQFTQTYPESSLKALARYWVGVTYLFQKEYDAALKVFWEVQERFPDAKKYEVFMKIAACYEGKQNKEEACRVLRNCLDAIDRDFDGGKSVDHKMRAEALARKLQCGPVAGSAS